MNPLWIRQQQQNFGFIQLYGEVSVVFFLDSLNFCKYYFCFEFYKFPMLARICYCYVMALAVELAVVDVVFPLNFVHRHNHMKNSIWNLVRQAMADFPIGQQLSNSFHFPFHEYSHKISVNCYNHCCHVFLLAVAAVLYHLLMLLSLLLLNLSELRRDFKIEKSKLNEKINLRSDFLEFGRNEVVKMHYELFF